MKKRINKGFTLLEILLVIAVIGILASIVIVAINPLRQIAKVRQAERASEINQLNKAIEQYNIAEGKYPDALTGITSGEYGEVCNTGKLDENANLGLEGVDCAGLIDLRVLVPTYVAEIPKDSSLGLALGDNFLYKVAKAADVDKTGYLVSINSLNSKVSIVAKNSTLGEMISINPLPVELTISGTVAEGQQLTAELSPTGFNLTEGEIVWYQIVGDNEVELGRGTTYTVAPGVTGEILVKLVLESNSIANNSAGTVQPLVVLASGDIDPTFNIPDPVVPQGTNTQVVDSAIQTDGKIILGGHFTTHQGYSANGIVRLNTNGSRDTSFVVGSGFSGWVYAVAIQPNDGKIVLGGTFNSYQGVPANRIIRLNTDGSRDTTFNIGTGFNNDVNDLFIKSDGDIMVGGEFSTYNGLPAQNSNLVRLNSDGSIDNNFNTGGAGPDSDVYSIAVQGDGKMMLGGRFYNYNGVSSNKIVRINDDGTRDSTFNPGTSFNSNVYSIAVQSDGKVVVGGAFTTYQGVAVNRIIRLDTNGNIDTSFNIGTGFGSDIWSMVIQSDGKVVVGGAFITYQGVSTRRIVRLNTDGSIDNTFNIGAAFGSTVYHIRIQSDNEILVGGSLGDYKGVTASGIIRLNINQDRDTIFDNMVATGLDKTVYASAIQSDGKVILGGVFTTYGGVSSNRIVRLNTDGSRDSSFNIGTGFNYDSPYNYEVLNIAIQNDGKVIVGGLFTTYQGVSAKTIIRLNSDGSRDTSFNIGTGFNLNYIYTTAIQSDGKVIVGGLFTDYQGVSANYIIRLNSDGTRDTSFNMGTGFGSVVRTIAIQSDGKVIVGGSFTTYQGVLTNRIIRLNSDGTRDTSFNTGTGFGGEVRTIVIQSDGKVIVGGNFTDYQGVSANYIIRLNSDGTRDTSFNMGTGFGSEVRTTGIQSDGKVIVGGNFTNYQGVSANRIIRLNNDGSRDNSFNIGTGFNDTVESIIIQNDNKVLVGGWFKIYKDSTAGCFKKLIP